MQRSLQQQVLNFNAEVHAFEDERRNDLDATIDIIQSLDPKGLKTYSNHLRENLNGIVKAKSIEELDLYRDSFNDVLNSLVMDDDVLGIYDCLIHYRQVIDLSNASFETDLKQDDEIKELRINTRLKWVDLGIEEFNKNAEELTAGLILRLEKKIKEEASQDEIDRLESGLKKINIIKEEIRKARQLAEEMLKAKNREEFDTIRLMLAEKLRYIQKIGGAKQSGKDLQNLFIRIGKRHADALYEARASYLPGPTSIKRKAVDFLWITAGAALTVVGVVLSAPVAVLAIGLAGAFYGTIDLAKEIAEPVTEHTMPKLGKREIVKPPPSNWERAKRIGIKALPIVVSVLALAAGIAALAFPPLAIPMAGIGLGLALIGGMMLGYKLYKETQKIKKIVRHHASIQNKYAMPVKKLAQKKAKPAPEAKVTEEEGKNLTKTLVRAKNSEAKIDLFLLGHKLNETVSSEEIQLLGQRQSRLDNIPVDNTSLVSHQKVESHEEILSPNQDKREKPEVKKPDDSFKSGR